MTESEVDLTLTGSFSIDRVGDFARIDKTKVRWRGPGGDTREIAFEAGNIFLRYVADHQRLLALLVSETSDEVYAIDPIGKPPVRVVARMRRYESNVGLRYLKFVCLDGDALIYYEQGLLRIGLNGEVRWIADPFPLGSSLDVIEADVVRLTSPDDRLLEIDLNSGRRIHG